MIASLVECLIWARGWASGDSSKFLLSGSSVPCFTSVTCSGHLARPCGPGMGTHIFQYFSRDMLKQGSLKQIILPPKFSVLTCPQNSWFTVARVRQNPAKELCQGVWPTSFYQTPSVCLVLKFRTWIQERIPTLQILLLIMMIYLLSAYLGSNIL